MNYHNLPPIDPQIGDWDEYGLNRCQFLRMGFWSLTGVASLFFSAAGTRFFVGHSLSDAHRQWVDLHPISELEPGRMHRLAFTYRYVDLWREEQRAAVVYALTHDGASFTVLDAACSHLGCNVHWKEGEDHFACPCHKGSYTR